MSHAQDRLAERYYLNLSHSEMWKIVKLIQEGKTICVKRETATKSHHMVLLNNRPIKVVYNSANKRVVTTLPFMFGEDDVYLPDLYAKNKPEGIIYLLDHNLNPYINIKLFQGVEFTPKRKTVYKLSVNNVIACTEDDIEGIHSFLNGKFKHNFELLIDNLDSLSLLSKIEKEEEEAIA